MSSELTRFRNRAVMATLGLAGAATLFGGTSAGAWVTNNDHASSGQLGQKAVKVTFTNPFGQAIVCDYAVYEAAQLDQLKRAANLLNQSAADQNKGNPFAAVRREQANGLIQQAGQPLKPYTIQGYRVPAYQTVSRSWTPKNRQPAYAVLTRCDEQAPTSRRAEMKPGLTDSDYNAFGVGAQNMNPWGS